MPAATLFNPAAISVGPGVLYIAAIGSVEPTSISSTYDVAFIPLGYTDSGHTFTTDNQTADITVAETLDPILVAPTGRVITVSFTLAEITAKHLQAAHNGGVVTTAGGAVKFEPPALGAAQPCMLAWDSLIQDERILWRNCISTGAIAIPRNKAPNKATIPVSFRVLQPSNAALAPFSHWLAAATRS